ncbi:MAG: poly-gamma-glutamate synthase PgsB [Leptospiraceae bacterium]|nr:poly-gamma-glutamate synthase PgsB [Leptospiraceae bacterium]MCP5500883.1 poly-gamma-glutamate synthase PgsB [Leptospiraceae bacterium]
MIHLYILLFVVAVVSFFGILEYVLHIKSLNRIPNRIHVNGTRGKSSVTRLIASALRAGGIVTCAKTTGTLPRMIFPDGREYPVFRNTRANIIEQIRIMRTASSAGANVLVIECMALQPLLQKLSEEKLVRATHSVVTNVRADHLDVMGPTEADIARAFCATVSTGGKFFTGEEKYLPTFQKACEAKNSTVHAVSKEELASVSDDDMAGFAYLEHKENVALALKVCADFGVDKQTALKGMWSAKPDPGVLVAYKIAFFGRDFYFVNAFAANDPDSTERIWNMVINRYEDYTERIAIFNCRVDRADRSRQLAEAYVTWKKADHIILMGTGTFVFAREAVKRGVDSMKISFVEGKTCEQIFEAIIDKINGKAVIMGMGNIGGQGLELVQYFKNRSIVKEAV